MKKNLFNLVGLIAVSLCLSTVSFAQIGNIVNKAKDAIDKKKEDKKTKKEEPKSNESPANNSSNNSQTNSTNSSSNDSPSNSSDNNPKPVQNEIGTIYFSNQPFPADGSVTGAKTSFNSNEFIYGRLVFKSGTLRENMKIFTKEEAKQIDISDPPYYQSDALANKAPFIFYAISLSKDGQSIYRSILDRVKLTDAETNKNYWDFDILPAPDKAKTAWADFNTPLPANIYTLVNPQNFSTEGKYQIRAVIRNSTKDAWGKLEKDQSKWLTVSGDLEFNFRMSDVAAIQTNKAVAEKSAKKFASDVNYENQEVPPEWTKTSNPIISITTLAKLKTLYLGIYSAADRANLQILKLYAGEGGTTGWIINRDDLGIPRNRVSNQYYTVFVKNTATKECFFDQFGLRQTYAGNGTYGESFIDRNENSQKWLKCEKLGVK